MKFCWDIHKDKTNRQKHNVSFAEASEVFGDVYSLCVDDPCHSVGEQRFLLFGVSFSGKYIVVSFMENEETIRIISAREMTRKERRAYEQ
ncbi:MAG: BrnT family toxin [Deltaproteobacteria bacterium]|nr:BrnT family toxin [Deltaproteobacteria bacterium]MBN2672915.1 BrnT family toxin [Deltaproteobacteria bacterium]